MSPIPLLRLNPDLLGLVQSGQWDAIGSRVAGGMSPHLLATPKLTVLEEFLRQAGAGKIPEQINEDEVFLDLISGLGTPDPDRPSPLALASILGRPKWVRWLLEKGCSPGELGEGHTPLTALASRGVELPLRIDRLASRPDHGWDQLEKMLRENACVELLLDAGAAVDAPSQDGGTPLLLACLAKNTRLAMLLLTRGANPNPSAPNRKGWQGMAPLEVAILSHNETLFRVLLEAGADPFARMSVRVKRGPTLVDLAAAWGQPGMMECLLERLEDRSAIDKAWWACLEEGNRPVVDWYLRKKVDLEKANDLGSLPSHILARFGHFDLLSDFYRRGMRVDAPDAHGQTALDILSVYHPHLYFQVQQTWKGLPGNVIQGCFPAFSSADG